MQDPDARAPMASAPMKYLPDGSVDWGTMWDSFCTLARDGGPPHRGTMLCADEHVDTEHESYQAAVQEIVRGIAAVSGLRAAAASPGWIAVQCQSAGMAHWLAESIEQEHVQARAEGTLLYVPVSGSYTVKGEIKNVITAVAKTTHYWRIHLPPEVQQSIALAHQIAQWTARLSILFRRAPR